MDAFAQVDKGDKHGKKKEKSVAEVDAEITSTKVKLTKLCKDCEEAQV